MGPHFPGQTLLHFLRFDLTNIWNVHNLIGPEFSSNFRNSERFWNVLRRMYSPSNQASLTVSDLDFIWENLLTIPLETWDSFWNIPLILSVDQSRPSQACRHSLVKMLTVGRLASLSQPVGLCPDLTFPNTTQPTPRLISSPGQSITLPACLQLQHGSLGGEEDNE